MQPTLCFVCLSNSVPPISSNLSNCGQILLEMVATFCNCMHINVNTFQSFGKLWFPFCEECRLDLMHLHVLSCDIEKLQRSMRQVTTQFCAKIISSTFAEGSVGITTGNRSSQKQDQLDLIQSVRKDIMRSYCPTVGLRRLEICNVLDEPVAVEVITISEDFVDTATDVTGGSENLNDHDAHMLDICENVATDEASNNFHNDDTFPEHQQSKVSVEAPQPSGTVEMNNIDSQIAEKTAEESVQEATSGTKKPRRKRKKRKDRVYHKPEHTPDELEEVSDTDLLYRGTFLLKKVAGSWGTYICPICDIAPKGLDDLIRHIRRSHLGEVPYQRGIIKMIEIAPNVWDYGGFTATKIPGGRYKCNTCVFLTHTRNYIRVHLRDRHLLKVRPECRLVKPWYFCDLCSNGKRFASQTILKAHIAAHSTIKDTKCDLCGKTFKSSHTLYSHKYRVHGKDSDKTFDCENCEKQIKGIQNFRRHVKNCASKRDFVCDICQKKYNSMTGLEHHMNHHKGTKYLCDYCGMDFAQQASLDRHKRNIHKVQANNPNSSTNVEYG